ncbi:uncharacterized protein LOC143237560 [Tachypleus tridentatus]|uniref:uncharacterized protein LOC143237560 n=1 Tax=Tachypleus tridentatus TaxID=6853 RepID=UPI003FD1E9D6
MPDLVGREKIERLAILVSGEGVEKILSVPKIDSGDANSVASEIGSVLVECNVKDRIKSLCFDTTATNTGSKSGVYLRIEMLLERKLLHLACIHHILKILLSAVFSTLVIETSKSPDITLVLNFRDCWPKSNKTKYITAVEAMPLRIQPWKDDIIQFYQNLLQSHKPRDDYKELLELAVIFLGSLPHGRSSVSFRTSGAVHHARWMA